VAGSGEYGDEPSGFGATELGSYLSDLHEVIPSGSFPPSYTAKVICMHVAICPVRGDFPVREWVLFSALKRSSTSQ
jgi:hypothetical protein